MVGAAMAAVAIPSTVVLVGLASAGALGPTQAAALAALAGGGLVALALLGVVGQLCAAAFYAAVVTAVLALYLASGRPSGDFLGLGAAACLAMVARTAGPSGVLASGIALCAALGVRATVVAESWVGRSLTLSSLVVLTLLMAWTERERRSSRAAADVREAALAGQAERALAADAVKSRFLARIGHEIRTPMNGIVGTARLLLRTDLSRQQRALAEALLASSQTLGRLLEQMLFQARLQAGEITSKRAPVEPAALAFRVLHGHAGEASLRGLDLGYVLAPHLPARVVLDEEHAGRILDALVVNAVRYTPAGHVVRRMGVVADRFVATVEDTGVGLDSDAVERLFAPRPTSRRAASPQGWWACSTSPCTPRSSSRPFTAWSKARRPTRRRWASPELRRGLRRSALGHRHVTRGAAAEPRHLHAEQAVFQVGAERVHVGVGGKEEVAVEGAGLALMGAHPRPLGAVGGLGALDHEPRALDAHLHLRRAHTGQIEQQHVAVGQLEHIHGWHDARAGRAEPGERVGEQVAEHGVAGEQAAQVTEGDVGRAGHGGLRAHALALRGLRGTSRRAREGRVR